MRIVNYLLAGMFVLFAALQLDDPDSVLWIFIYLSVAVISVLASISIYPRKFTLGLIIILSTYAIFYFPGVTEWLHQDNLSELFDDMAKMKHPYIEETREFLGLIICIITLFFQLLCSRRKSKTD